MLYLYDGGKLVCDYLDKYTKYIFKELIKNKKMHLTKNDKNVLEKIKSFNKFVIYYFDLVFNIPYNEEIVKILKNSYNDYKNFTSDNFQDICLMFGEFNINVSVNYSHICYELNYIDGKIVCLLDVNKLVNGDKISYEWMHHNYQSDDKYLEVLRGNKIFSINRDSEIHDDYENVLITETLGNDPIRYFLERIKKDNRELIYKKSI